MSKSERVYESLSAYLATRDDYVVTASAVQLAHLAARAYVSGEAAEGAKFAKASLEALKGFAKSKGYAVDVTEGDVLGMAVVSAAKSPDPKGQWTVGPEDRYLERLVRFGRATKLPTAKAKASPKGTAKAKGGTVTLTKSALADIIADAVAKALNA